MERDKNVSRTSVVATEVCKRVQRTVKQSNKDSDKVGKESIRVRVEDVFGGDATGKGERGCESGVETRGANWGAMTGRELSRLWSVQFTAGRSSTLVWPTKHPKRLKAVSGLGQRQTNLTGLLSQGIPKT